MGKQENKQTDPQEEQFPGYPSSPAGEDIYQREPHVPLQTGADNNNMGLDVPGAELDDANENIGEEDEENNYYSLGGDNHNDLEENGTDD